MLNMFKADNILGTTEHLQLDPVSGWIAVDPVQGYLLPGTQYSITLQARSAGSGTLRLADLNNEDLDATMQLGPDYAGFEFTFTSTAGQYIYIQAVGALADVTAINLAPCVQFRTPLRDSSEGNDLVQATGLDTDGVARVYDKGAKQLHRPRLALTLTAAELEVLLQFAAVTVRGSLTPFFWVDHGGAVHTVRLVGDIRHQQTAADRYKVDLELEAAIAWAAPTDLGTWDDAVHARDAAPVWILKLIVNSAVYYLSDMTVTIPEWSNAVTLPWVASFGDIKAGVGNLTEFKVSDLQVGLFVDPAASPNMETLALDYPLEKSPAELYLWFRGAAGAPQLAFRGYVRDVDLPDETTCNLVIEDETIRLKAYVGAKADTTTYPGIDPDDVGKVVPIVYGTVTRLPALAVDAGVITTILVDITAAATGFNLTSTTGLAVGKTIMIDAEKMYISGISGQWVTVTRGYAATTATVHAKGAQAWEQKATPLVYLLADHPLDSIGQIVGVVNGIEVDITADCTKYFGTVGNQHASYPGKAVVTIADFLALRQTLSLTDPDHNHGVGNTSIREASVSGCPYDYTLLTTGYQEIQRTATFNDTAPGNRAAVTYELQLSFQSSFTYSAAVWLQNDDGSLAHQVWAASGLSGVYVANLSFDSPGDHLGLNKIYAVIGSTNVSITMHFQSCTRTIRLSNTDASDNPSGVTLSGNSIANTVVGEQLRADVTRNVTAPAAVIANLLTNWGGGLALSQVGTFPAGYAFNGAITDYRRVQDWCDRLAFQCRAFFRVDRGSAKLMVRPDTPSGPTVIDACRVTDSAVRIHRRRKSDRNDVINRINLLYDRDYTLTGDDAYRKSSKASDATSITDYGEHERPELFKFDFVTSQAMADNLRNFYLAYYKDRHWRHEFDVFLDWFRLGFADVVTLGFSRDEVGQVMEVGYNPGSGPDIDTINLVVEE